VDDGGVAEAIRAAPGAHGLARCRRVGEQQGVGDVLAAVGDPLREKVPAEQLQDREDQPLFGDGGVSV